MNLLVVFVLVSLSCAQDVNWTCYSEDWDVDDPLSSCGIGNPHVSFGEDNMEVVDDPLGEKGNVLRIRYPEGSGGHQDEDNKGGIQFRFSTWEDSDDLYLEYDVMFSDNFDFVKGGKLPGFFGGDGDCSGCRIDTGCFSSRYMWRTDGDLEIYGYVKSDEERDFCDDNPHVVCNDDCGDSFGRFTIRMQPDRWYRIGQRINLNDVGEDNGSMSMYVDGQEYFNLESLTYRNDDSIQISEMYFSTFFGGSDESWATPETVYIYYTNFHVYN